MIELPHKPEAVSLPEGFQAALREDAEGRMIAIERDWETRIDVLIADRRDEAAEMYQEALEDHQNQLRHNDDDLRRSLRGISARGAAKVASIERRRLEIELRHRLDEIRRSSSYPVVIENLLAQSASVIDRIDHFEATEPEASILKRLTGVPVRPADDERWGGFKCVDEGGTILDCTFRTRWDRLCASRSPEEIFPGVEF